MVCGFSSVAFGLALCCTGVPFEDDCVGGDGWPSPTVIGAERSIGEELAIGDDTVCGDSSPPDRDALTRRGVVCEAIPPLATELGSEDWKTASLAALPATLSGGLLGAATCRPLEDFVCAPALTDEGAEGG